MTARRNQPEVAVFVRDDRGAVAVEYAILLTMIAIALLASASLTDISGYLGNTFNHIAETMASH